MPVRIYRNVNAEGPTPGVFYIHGGGMIMGDLSMGELSVIRMCEVTGATFVSVDYRLAPEHPYPAAVEDCFAALCWMDANRGDIGVRPGALSIVGASAGGGLTIATSLVARDRGGPEVGFQMPFYPMIDDRNETPSSHEIIDIGIWDRAGNIEAWGWYLGARKPTAMPPLPVPQTFPTCRRPTWMSARWTCFATRTLPSVSVWFRPVCRSSSISGRARSTLQRPSRPARRSASVSGRHGWQPSQRP